MDREAGWDGGGKARGPGGYHVDELVAELLQDDNDPGGCVVVLGGGPDEADGVQHLGDERRELGRDGRAGAWSQHLSSPLHTAPGGGRSKGKKRCPQYLCLTTARKPAAPCCPKTQAQSPTSQPRDPLLLMYRREVGLFHLLQQDTQGLQVQNDIVGFLQACVEQEQGFIPTGAETGPHP